MPKIPVGLELVKRGISSITSRNEISRYNRKIRNNR